MKKTSKESRHPGSSFDSFLDEHGIREEVDAVAIKRVLAWQLEEAMKDQGKTKSVLARQMGTSRSQLNRLLDPNNVAVSLETVSRAARALGKRMELRILPGRFERSTTGPVAARRRTY
jgi:DNA-binding phage protein